MDVPAGYHIGSNGGIVRDYPRKHMTKKERLRRRWQGRDRFGIAKLMGQIEEATRGE